jgi:hypothetical protein
MARTPLRAVVSLQLGIVRVAERCRGCFGCVEPVCVMRA